MDVKKTSARRKNDSNLPSASGYPTQKDYHKPVRKMVTPTSSLEIVDGDVFDGASSFCSERTLSESSFRSWSRTSGSVAPRPDSNLSRRTVTPMTPVKQVSLQAVRRKEESGEPCSDDVAVDQFQSSSKESSRRKAWEFQPNDDDVDFSNLSLGNNRPYNSRKGLGNSSVAKQPATTNDSAQLVDQSMKLSEVDNKDRPSSGDDDNNDDDNNEENDEESDDEDKDENEKQKAPTELLMEFIDCLMKHDFVNASKLCKMILLYEPENEEALKFQPLIEEKMALDAVKEAEGSSSDDDGDDDSSSGDDDDDSSDSDSSSEDDSDDDDEEKPRSRKGSLTDKSKTVSANSNKTGGKDLKGGTSKTWKPAS